MRSCSREALNPLCDASVLFLVLRFSSKCVFSVRLIISCLIFSKVFVSSRFQWKIDFLFSKGRSGLPKDAKFGTNLIYWFMEPKNNLNSFKFIGIGKSFNAFVLWTKGKFQYLKF